MVEIGGDRETQQSAAARIWSYVTKDAVRFGTLLCLFFLLTVSLVPFDKPALPFDLWALVLVIGLFSSAFVADQYDLHFQKPNDDPRQPNEWAFPRKLQIIQLTIFVAFWIRLYFLVLIYDPLAYSNWHWPAFLSMPLPFLVACSILIGPAARDWFERSVKVIVFAAANYALVWGHRSLETEPSFFEELDFQLGQYGLSIDVDPTLLTYLGGIIGLSCLLYVLQRACVYASENRRDKIEHPLVALRQVTVFALLFLGSARFIYLLVQHGRPDSAALYIGLPTVVAMALALAPESRTATGKVLRTMTIGLIMAGLIIGPGILCLLIMAPVFYLFAMMVSLSFDALRLAETERERRGAKLRCSAVLLVAMASALEGTHPALTFNTHEVVRIERVYETSAAAFEAALEQPMAFSDDGPMVLRIGFPYPVHAFGSGTAIGDRRGIHLEDRNIYFNVFGGSRAMNGDVIFEVTQRTENSMRLTLVEDTSAVSKWLRWRHSDLRWTALGPDRVSVSLDVHFDRRLDPAWYFAPLQRAVVRAAAPLVLDSMIDSSGL